ncbi:hypothetical protein CERZMDRAFT_113185 [Cercospora zeae-maydis SCOH1-5]|uniref:Uncharacterized protein n=1 Tax=Cercospora zeae-maydis SCOH1-5 TaxID=717836 RepID=A0A6A6FB88_9PEZI|nr:hypothetical protein CERZMDRAFT_113185 [Cercospora zeae-maydis SCOH1-5]
MEGPPPAIEVWPESRTFSTGKYDYAYSRLKCHAIPTPFIKAPASLAPFLDRLDPSKVHITHIDRNPRSVKKNIFLIPVLLNGFIAALLFWRLYYAIPKYYTLLQTLLGYSTSETVDTVSTTRKQQIKILLSRTLTMAFDFMLFRFVGPWPLTFFFEQPANPCSYRWGIGFRDEEVIVRVSRNWNTNDLMQGVKQGQENAFFKTRILPAISHEEMRKTGYLMMNESWDLEFELMGDAETLVKRKEVRKEDLDKVVFAFLEGGKHGWVMWKWQEEDVIEARRKKVVAFKEVLTKLGKESLFWRWTEIVEAERDADGGFTARGQENVVDRVKAEFEKEGVDFEEIVNGIA